MWQRSATAMILPQGWHFTFYLKPLDDHARFRAVAMFCSRNGNWRGTGALFCDASTGTSLKMMQCTIN